MDEGGERRSEIQTELRVDRRIELQFQGVGYWGDEMASPVEFTSVFLKMIGSRVGRFLRRRGGV